jgi:phosphatidylserine decarboxylase
MAAATTPPERLATGARLFVGLQYLLPQHALSRIVRRATRSRWRWLKDTLIRLFMRSYRPDLSDARIPDPLAYESFNAFFTRHLPRAAVGSPCICSPVDGCVSMAGAIEGETLLQAKGRAYTLGELLAGDAELAARYRGGRFATIYLAPCNYHRIHMPLDGALRASWYVPGRLFSVNAATAASVPRLFARNERVICDFDGTHGAFAVVLVGALFVGSMSTAWHGSRRRASPPACRLRRRQPASPVAAMRSAASTWDRR